MNNAVISICGTILGVLIGSLITYWFSKDLVRKTAITQNFINASDTFKSFWIPIYLEIHKAANTDLSKFTNSDFAYRKAFEIGSNEILLNSTIVFQRSLNRKDAFKFRTKCDRLFEKTNNCDFKNIDLFSSGNDSLKTEQEATVELDNIIEHILSYSDYK